MAYFTVKELSLRLQRELLSSCVGSLRNGEVRVDYRNVQKSVYRPFRARRDVTPKYAGVEQVAIDPGSEPMIFSRLFKPFIFTIGFSATCLVGATIWQYENMRTKYIDSKTWTWGFTRHVEKKGTIRQELNHWWRNRTEGEKVFIPICALNCIVFAAWRFRRFQPTMAKYFLSTPSRKNLCWPMFLSSFSHVSIIHLAANMFVLHSFSNILCHTLGKEQFVGLYLSSGVVSSFASYFYKIVSKNSGFTLGASGAIMAMVSYICFHNPEEKLYILFLPFFTFQAGAAIKAIMAFDAAGLIFSWKFLDHAAHLGGALLGIAWYQWGNRYIWQKREPILEKWHEFRGTGRKR